MKMDSIPCYIYNKNTGATVSFDIAVPDSISDSYQTNYESHSTKGRSSPFKAYQNSGPRSVSFSVIMSLDYRRDLLDTVDALRDMLKPCNFGYIKAPYVHVRIGDVLDINAVPLTFDAVWKEGYKENKYRICECSFSFDMVEDAGTFATSKGSEYQYTQTTVRGNQIKSTTVTYDLGEGRVDTGIQGSTENDLQIGKTITLSEIKHGYGSSSYAEQFGDNYEVDILPGTYMIYSKYKNALKIAYKGDYYWINPYR